MPSMIPDHAKTARDLLTFYVEAGADACLSEAPVNQLAGDTHVLAPNSASPARPNISADETLGAEAWPQNEPAPRTPLRRSAAAEPRPASAPLHSPDAAALAAREAARNAKSLEELQAILRDFEGCALRATAKQLVFADGNPNARVMFVGEAPGRDEDLEGLPFVGRSGKLLDRMLAAIGLDRSSVYIANIVPWRPPGNRDPSLQETQICLPFITRQIELVDPDVLVCMGKPATAGLLGISDGIRKTRGRWFSYRTGTREIRAIATFHPAYLLRSPLEKRLAWRDFLAIRKALAG
jgi:uracil-DNA glycosylase family 4